VNFGSDGYITVIDTSTFVVVATHLYKYNNGSHHSDILDLAAGPSNRLYISPEISANYAVDVMDLTTGNIIASIPLGENNSTKYLIEATETNLFVIKGSYGSQTPQLKKYDISNAIPDLTFETTLNVSAKSMMLAPNGFFLAIIGSDNILYQYDTTDFTILNTKSIDGGFKNMSISADSQNLLGLYHPQGYYGPGAAINFETNSGEQTRSVIDSVEMKNSLKEAKLSTSFQLLPAAAL
jgi:hypothetical protein